MSAVTRSQKKLAEEQAGLNQEGREGVPTDMDPAGHGAAASHLINPPPTSIPLTNPDGRVIDHRDPKEPDEQQPPPGQRPPPPSIPSDPVGSVLYDPRGFVPPPRPIELKSTSGSNSSRRSQRTALDAQRRQVELEIEMERAKIRMQVLEKQLALRMANIDAAEAAAEEEADERHSEAQAASQHRVEEWLSRTPRVKEEAPRERGQIPRPSATEVRFDETLPHTSQHTPKRERSEERPRRSMEGLEKLADAIVGMSRPRPRQTYELPKFDGNPADWPTFKCMYERSTATYKFEAYENVARLQQALVGAAKSAVEDILRGVGDPSDVMCILEEEFGHPSAILDYALKKIKALPRVTDSGSELKKFTSVVRNCVSLLRNVKADGYLNNPQLVSELLNKLSPLQRTLYGDFVKYKDSMCSVDLRVSPSLDILLEFLTERSRSASYLVPMDLAAPSASATHTAPRPRVMPVHRNVQKVATVTSAPVASRSVSQTVSSAPVASRTPQTSCVLCNENHSLPSCRKFVALDNSERWNVAKDNKLCFKCLCYRHAREFCRAKRCEQCNAPHHELLHYVRPAEDASVPPTSVPETEVKQALSVGGTCTKALLKIVPVSIKRDNCVIQTHALLDDGATVSLMDSSLVTYGNGEPCPLTIVTANGQRVTDSESRRVRIRLCGPNGLEHCVNVRTMAQLNLPTQTIPMEVYKNTHLSDLCDTMDCSEDCKEGRETKPLLLLGQDNWELIVGREIRRGKSGQPIASLTQLGWVIHGPLGNCASTSSDCESVHCAAVVAKSRLDSDLHNLVKMQFELDSIGIAEVERKNVETERANTILERTSRRVEGGWECGLLWKNENPSFPNNYNQALSRLKGIERRMDKDPKFSAAYVAQIERLLNEGYAEKVPDGWNAEPKWYLPHFGVVNPNKPGKLRLVYDAAASYKGVSMNSNLLSGPVLLNSLFGVLARFRCGRIAVKGDIADMFLRVKIRNEDKGAQLFLWRGQERDRRPDVYVMNSMIFGATSSPSMAMYILNKNARDLAGKFPNAVDPIEKNHYVDDYLDSFDNKEMAKKVVNEVLQAHAAGGFHIRGWVSNSPDMCERADGTAQVAQNVEFGKGLEQVPIERTLGLIWNPQSDDLSFDLSFKKIPGEIASGEVVPTKRQYLRLIMSVFDPLGFLSPAVIPTKILLQQIWKSDIGWDDKLQDREAQAWRRWIENVNKISTIRVPRCYGLDLSRDLELHVFGDASELAYAAVAYLVGVNGNGERVCSLVAGKARVAPLKIVSIPRLELQAAVLACRLGNSIRNELGLVVGMYYWTDSQTVLRWIASDARDYQRFVSHRLSEIESKSERGDWRWVASAENPADEATKLGWPRDRSIWFSGPSFLRDPPHLWPKAVTEEVPEANLELRVNVVAQVQLQEPLVDLRRFSSWERAVRVTARALAFVRKCRGRKTDHLEKEDFRDAETLLLKEAQKEHFMNEIGILRSGKSLPTNSKLRALDPMLYEDGLLRVRGRIGASNELSFDERHPIIIDGHGWAAHLIVKYYHNKTAHAGTEHVVNSIRERYWVTDIRNTVKKLLRSCVICKCLRGQPRVPKMADLPEVRVQSTRRAFVHCGIDYFGPMEVTIGRRREKRWGVLFTCLSTRAVHMELAASLNIDSAILALRRLIARRGQPETMRSDRGTNFVGADKELRAALKEFDHEKLAEAVRLKNIEWIFNPPAAPHMGGIWERLVRSIKNALRVTLRQMAPREEVLHTLLLEAELTVNSRPLSYVPVGDAASPTVLTPNHLLLGTGSGAASFAPSCAADLDVRHQWRRANALADEFWRRWRREYLPTLQRRVKWKSDSENVKIDDIVVICDETIPRNQWPKGKIVQVHPGRDGKVRIVDVKTGHGVLRRPVTKIIVLPTADIVLG